MSGPKGVSYSVVSEAELRRRALAAAHQRLSAAKARVAELQAVADLYAATAGVVPILSDTDVPAELEAQAQALSDYCEALQNATRKRQAALAAERLQSTLSGFSLDLAVARITPAATTSTPRTAHSTGNELTTTLAELARHVAELPAADRDAFASRLTAVAQSVDKADPARAAQMVTSLRVAVGNALRDANQQASFERRRAALAQEYADLTGTAAATLQAVAVAADDRELAKLRAEFVTARACAVRAADQSFVIAQAEDVLTALGYRVQVSRGDGVGEIVARKDSWQHHGLRLLFPESQAAFSSIPEAYGATDIRDDVAFERESCADVTSLLTGMRERGIETELRAHRQPGAVPVRRASEAPKYQRRVAAPKERAL